MTQEAEMNGHKMTVSEAVGSLTGFDEIAIEKTFKADIGSLAPTTVSRALAFVLVRRGGKDDKEAYGDVMRMTLATVNAMFASEDDDAGKD